MVTLHPNIFKRDGKRAFAVLPYEEFLRVREELEHYDFSCSAVRRKLGI